MTILAEKTYFPIESGVDILEHQSFFECLRYYANQTPDKKSIICASNIKETKNQPTYTSFTFQQLYRKTLSYINGLSNVNIGKGTRVLILAKPSIDFTALFFSLDAIGAIPVIIDPGIGINRLLNCIKNSAPQVIIADPKAFLLKIAFKKYFNSIKTSIITQKSILAPRAISIQSLCRNVVENKTNAKITKLKGNELGGILFTSGSTGLPKGVELTRNHILAQKKFWNSTFKLSEKDVDLVTFPIFLLVSISSGRTCIIPNMDFSKPGLTDPSKIQQAIEDHAPTFCFASPALWNHLTKHTLSTNSSWESLKTIVSGGAPVPYSVLQRLRTLSPNSIIYTPYGSTEALPITSITYQEINAETQKLSEKGHGTCVGKPIPGIRIKIIKDSQQAIPFWDERMVLKPFEIGEVVVNGPVVTEKYFDKPEMTHQAKIYEINADGKTLPNGIWHRMGDLGYLDHKGRLWFCGRKTHKAVQNESVYYSVKVEGIFNAVEEVWRTALVNVQIDGKPRLALAVELEPGNKVAFKEIEHQLLSLAKQHSVPITIFLHHKKPFPVDRRHNSKIERNQLAHWAQTKV